MRKIELLAPAGSFEALVAAINSGADAIYLGGALFNARAFATNFSNEQLIEAVNLAHLHQVKIYVTVNTLFYDEEFEELMKYIAFLYSINVDALIIQDMGLLNLVKTHFPDFEIHMSTQASIHQLSGVKLFEELKVDRVVLARENTLEEIKNICENTSLDIEVFVHGALCMSYSGQCLMSSLIGGRSGNRGKCAQPCRLPYILKENDHLLDKPHYILSAKDICVLENIQDYIEAGVTSFKIEGRMKRPEYVGLVVKSYREAIDAYLNNETYLKLESQKTKINQMFNRGLSLGHAYHEKKLITYDFSGNFGVEIGEVIKYDAKKKLVSVRLTKELVQGDGIRFGFEELGRVVNKLYYQNRLINKAMANQIVDIEFNERIKVGVKVYKTSSILLNKEINNTIAQTKFNDPISMQLIGKIDQPLILKLTDGEFSVEVSSESVVQKALSQPLTPERIKQQLEKLGSTIYKAQTITLDLDKDIQFSIKDLNELRRQAVMQLNEQRIKHQRTLKSVKLPNYKNTQKTIADMLVHVQNLTQAKAALKCNIKVLCIPFTDESMQIIEEAKLHNVQVIPYVSRIISDKELDEIKNHEIYPIINSIIIGDFGALHYFKDKKTILDTSLNITNCYSLNHEVFDFSDVILSLEMTENQINHLHTQKRIGIVAYGKAEMMIAKYCPISEHYFKEKKVGCNLCKKAQYSLVDRKKEAFPIIMDTSCKMHLYNSQPLFIDRFNDLNVDFIVLKFTDEKDDEVMSIINDYILNLSGYHQSRIKGDYRYTLGYFKK